MLKRVTGKKIMFTMFLVLCCFLALELLMILLEPWLFRGFYQYDRDMGFKVRPYTRGSNRFGFNDKDYPLEKEPGTYRILVLGDSFNWAGGYENNYATILEELFEEHFGRHVVDVINAGYPMTWAKEQLVLLRKYGLQYNPDLVVLGFFAGNDFFDAELHRKRIVVNDTYFDIDERREVVLFGRPIMAQSRLFSFIRQKAKTFGELFAAKKEAAEQPASGRVREMRGLFPGVTFLEIERKRLEFCNRASYDAGEREQQICLVLNELTDMDTLLNEKRVGFMVAIYPDEFQVNQGLQYKLASMYKLDFHEYDLELMQTILTDYLRTEAVPYVDLLPKFREAGKKERLYRWRDTHWNVRGNRLAAELLFKRLRSVVEARLGMVGGEAGGEKQ